MKPVIICIILFFILFFLAIPAKMENNRLAALILQEKSLEDSIFMMRYDLALVEKSIDSLSSRKRIDTVTFRLGLGLYGVATKITGHAR